MVKRYDDTNIKAIADAIREKNGTENTYKTSEMASAILEIQAGGGDIDALIDRSITEISSNVTSIGDAAFEDCESLITADFPLVTSIGGGAFTWCKSMKSINFPSATSIGISAFSYCNGLTSVVFPEVTSIGTSAFVSCKNIEKADFHKNVSFGAYTFRYGHSLIALILRSTTMCRLSVVTAFSECYKLKGLEDETYNPAGERGYVYVPASLVDSYTADASWASIGVEFRAIESYTVDGTITGELDASKI